jgi:hypothetical protein
LDYSSKKALIGVIGYYIGDTDYLQETVLGFREIKGRHRGENLASTTLEVVGEYGIASKLGYFVMDNADSNTVTAIYYCNHEEAR